MSEQDNGNDVNSMESASSTESNNQETVKTVPVENRIAELNRKTDKKFNDLAAKLDQLSTYLTSMQPTAARETTYEGEMVPKGYVDARVKQVYEDQLREKQHQSWKQAVQMFPELDPESDSYDDKFFKLADKEFLRFRQDDVDAPLTAVEIAARKMGLYEKRSKEFVLEDDARRSRILGQGGAPTKSTKEEKSLKMNEGALKRFFGIDAKKLEKRIKSDPERYGKGS